MNLKKFLIPLALVSSVGVMVGCDNSVITQVQKEESVKKDLVIEDVKTELLASGILEQASFDSKPQDSYIFENVKDVIEDGFVSQAMINVRLQDVIFVKTSDVDAVEEAILEYKTNTLTRFGDGYGGEDNVTAVADSKLVKMDGYVYFIATKNAQEVEDKLLELIK